MAYADVGLNIVVPRGAAIGRHAVIKSGSVVVRDVLSSAVVAGSYGRLNGMLNEE